MASLALSSAAGLSSLTSCRVGCQQRSISVTRGNCGANKRIPAVVCQASNDKTPPAPAVETRSILCPDCTGNGEEIHMKLRYQTEMGAIACKQCKGEGINSEDHFGGQFKAGATCWLCRGKRMVLCGNCNGAGFVGGFMSTKDD